MSEQRAPRDAFGAALLAAARSDKRVVALSADLAESLRLLELRTELPEQFIELGVAEQNLMGVAAGMAMAGAVPFACSFAVFNPGRNWDQLRVSVCYQQANVKVIGGHAGLSVGPDGATHQALEDIAITRVLPGLTVIAPTDALETEKAVRFAIEHQGPVYIRFGRDAVPAVTAADTPFEYGKANLLRDGTDILLCAIGPLVAEALTAAETLQGRGISAAVAAFPFVKPLDTAFLEEWAGRVQGIVAAEDHQAAGGLGSAIAEHLATTRPVPMRFVAMPDTFGQSGSPKELYAHYGMDASAIESAAASLYTRIVC